VVHQESRTAALALIQPEPPIEIEQENDVATSLAIATSIAAPANFDYSANAAATTTENAAASAATTQAAAPESPVNDRRRFWLWSFLAVVVASQFYFVRELVGAFALFVIAFVAIAIVVICFYMLVKCAELSFARLASIRKPSMQLAPIANRSHKPA